MRWCVFHCVNLVYGSVSASRWVFYFAIERYDRWKQSNHANMPIFHTHSRYWYWYCWQLTNTSRSLSHVHQDTHTHIHIYTSLVSFILFLNDTFGVRFSEGCEQIKTRLILWRAWNNNNNKPTLIQTTERQQQQKKKTNEQTNNTSNKNCSSSPRHNQSH